MLRDRAGFLSILARATISLVAAHAASPAVVSASTPTRPDAVVAADGSGQFRTVQEAVDAAPAGRTGPFVIHIEPGTYRGHIAVPQDKPFLSLHGNDAATTILSDDRNVFAEDDRGRPLTTRGSASTVLQGDDFVAEGLTFENAAGNHGQALAIYADADRCIFRRCRFLGWQDTVRVEDGRSLFEDCRIVGHVDFLYGSGTAFFERCHIHCLADGFITAAATDRDAPYGYVFRDCRVTADPSVGRIHLGRPWQPFASVIFIDTELPAAVVPAGWNNWGNPENEETVRYAESNSTGPGANPTARVPWSRQLTDAEADAITAEKVLAGGDGWDPRS
jgi:pectinesterase